MATKRNRRARPTPRRRQGPRTLFQNKVREPRTYCMTATGNSATEALQAQRGLSRSDVLELGVRKLAGIPVDAP